MSDLLRIDYSISAKAHELTLLKLKSLDIENMNPTDLAKKYYEINSEIEAVLESPRKAGLK